MGEFDVSLSSIKYAAEDRAVREWNPIHLAELDPSFRTNSANGIRINFPPATEVIFEEEFQNEAYFIEVIVRIMQELYPEKK